MWAVIKKELKSYFTTPIGYIFIGVFLVALSISFYFSVIGAGSVNLERIYYSLPTIIVLAVIIPLLTMRSFAEERKSGTSPLSITKIVLGKFISAAVVVIITELISFMYFAITSHFGAPHVQTALVTMFGFLLFCMTYIAFGILASSITENQIIAAIISIAFFIITWVLPDFNTNLSGLSFVNMLYKYTQGEIDIADTVTFVTSAITSIILTITLMQRRKSVK